MTDQAPQVRTTPSHINVLARLKGILIVIGSIGCGAVGWFAIRTLANNIRNNPDTADDMSPLALRLIQQPLWLLLIAAATMAVGIVMIAAPRSRPVMWLLFLLGMGGILVIFAAVLYCFVSFIGPMYEYKPL